MCVRGRYFFPRGGSRAHDHRRGNEQLATWSSPSDPPTSPVQRSTAPAPVTFYLDRIPLVGASLIPQFYNPSGPRRRTRTTDAQLKVLLEVYAQDHRPTKTRRREIAQQIGMTVKQVRIWFQNRRATAKTNERKHLENEGARIMGIPWHLGCRHSALSPRLTEPSTVMSKGPPKFAHPARPLDPSPGPEEKGIILHPVPVPKNETYSPEPAPPSVQTVSSLVSSMPEVLDEDSRVPSLPASAMQHEQRWRDAGLDCAFPQYSRSEGMSSLLNDPAVNTPAATISASSSIGPRAPLILSPQPLRISTEILNLLSPGHPSLAFSPDSSPTACKTHLDSLSPNCSRFQQDAMFGRHQSLPGFSPSRQRSTPNPSSHGLNSGSATHTPVSPTSSTVPSRLVALRKSTMGFVASMRKSGTANLSLSEEGRSLGRHCSGSFSERGNRGPRGSVSMPISAPPNISLPSALERRRKRGTDREGGGSFTNARASSSGELVSMGDDCRETGTAILSISKWDAALGAEYGYMPHPLATMSSRGFFVRSHEESQHVIASSTDVPLNSTPTSGLFTHSLSHGQPYHVPLRSSRSSRPISASLPEHSYSHKRSPPTSSPHYPPDFSEFYPPVRPVVPPPPGPLPSPNYTLGTLSSSGSPSSGSGNDKETTSAEDDDKGKEGKGDARPTAEGTYDENTAESSSVTLQDVPPSSPRSLFPFTVARHSQSSVYSSCASLVAHLRHASTASQESFALRFGSTPSINSTGSFATPSISTGTGIGAGASLAQNAEDNKAWEDMPDTHSGDYHQQELLSAPCCIQSMPMSSLPSVSQHTSSANSPSRQQNGLARQEWSVPSSFTPDMRRASCPATFLRYPILESANGNAEEMQENADIVPTPTPSETSPPDSSAGGGARVTPSVFVEPRSEDAPSVAHVHGMAHVPTPTRQTELASPQTDRPYIYQCGSPETNTSVGSSPSVYLTPRTHPESPYTPYTAEMPMSTPWNSPYPPQTSYGPGHTGYTYDHWSMSGQLHYPREMSISSYYTPGNRSGRQVADYNDYSTADQHGQSLSNVPLAVHGPGTSPTIYSRSPTSSSTVYDQYNTSPAASTIYCQDTPASTWAYMPTSIVPQVDTPDSVLSDYSAPMIQLRYEPPVSYQPEYNAPKVPARSSLAGARGPDIRPPPPTRPPSLPS